jgi:hypothetical protein
MLGSKTPVSKHQPKSSPTWTNVKTKLAAFDRAAHQPGAATPRLLRYISEHAVGIVSLKRVAKRLV